MKKGHTAHRSLEGSKNKHYGLYLLPRKLNMKGDVKDGSNSFK